MDVLSGLSIFATVWFGLWVIPAAIMHPETRRLYNVVNFKTSLYLLLMILMNVALVLPEGGSMGTSVLKVLVLSLLPFGSAYLMVRFYHSTVR